MFSEEADLLQQIEESRKVIQQKHFTLKHGLQNSENQVSQLLQPIITPLNKIVNQKSLENGIVENRIRKKERKPIFSHSTPHKTLRFDDQDYDETEFHTVGQFDSHKADLLITDEANVSGYLKILNDNQSDTKYGVRIKNSTSMIGNKPIRFKDQQIVVGDDQSYPMTTGLLELLFKAKPNEQVVSQSDISNYRDIIRKNSVLKKWCNPNAEYKKDLSGEKYIKYLQNISGDIHGQGLPKYIVAKQTESSYDYRYWDDPNELVDRLKLLLAEREAGNNNHDNEIHAIIEELREARIIV